MSIRRNGRPATTRQRRQQIFTASGTWPRPPGVDTVDVLVVGGGGGGGGSFTGASNLAGGGGGGEVRELADLAVTGDVTVTIGAGGAGGTAGAAGGQGGASSFGSGLNAADGTAPIAAGGGGGEGGSTSPTLTGRIGGGGGTRITASGGQAGAGGAGSKHGTPGIQSDLGPADDRNTVPSGTAGVAWAGRVGCDGSSGAGLYTIPGVCAFGYGHGGPGGRTNAFVAGMQPVASMPLPAAAGPGNAAAANTGGGGGGGAGIAGVAKDGGNGGSGIVIVSWWE